MRLLAARRLRQQRVNSQSLAVNRRSVARVGLTMSMPRAVSASFISWMRMFATSSSVSSPPLRSTICARTRGASTGFACGAFLDVATGLGCCLDAGRGAPSALVAAAPGGGAAPSRRAKPG